MIIKMEVPYVSPGTGSHKNTNKKQKNKKPLLLKSVSAVHIMSIIKFTALYNGNVDVSIRLKYYQ
jgi:hypothetical protein